VLYIAVVAEDGELALGGGFSSKLRERSLWGPLVHCALAEGGGLVAG
jgi:hypothetical protein